jgi:hypothetical protein
MLILRIIGILTAITIGSAIVAWLVTRDRRYLSLAWRVSKGAVVVALAIFALLIAERLLVIV